jgi:hypothetical protein
VTDPKCPKCKSDMEKGFIADFKEEAGAITAAGVMVSRWVEGEPEESFWTGLKLSDRRQMEIRTYRCFGCGYLESYAPEIEGLLVSRLNG